MKVEYIANYPYLVFELSKERNMGLFFDIVFLLVLVFLVPLYFQYRHKHFKGTPKIKGPAKYVRTITIAVFLLTLLSFSWIVNHRTFTDLGLGYPDTQGFIGIAVAIVIIALLLGMMTVSSKPDSSDEFEKEKILSTLPNTRLEVLVYIIFSVVIGFAWEVLYRGALIYYFSPYIGLMFSVLLAALIYTITHGASSWKGYLNTYLMALMFLILFVLSGSLWGPIIMHIAAPLIMPLLLRDLKSA